MISTFSSAKLRLAELLFMSAQSRYNYVTSITACSFIFIFLTLGGQALATDDQFVFSTAEIAKIQSFGPWPLDIPQDPGNELSGLEWAEALGKILFEDARLSKNGTLSCATCHQSDKAFSENQSLAVGMKRHVRNSQGLVNSALQRWFGWDGGADSLWGASLRPLFSSTEMGNDIQALATQLRLNAEFMSTLSTKLGVKFHARTMTDEKLAVLAAKTMGAYVRTLRSGTTAFDKFRASFAQGVIIPPEKYSIAARRGLKLFLGEANCFICHYGPNFSNGEFHDTGRPFFTGAGQVDAGRYTGIQRVRDDRYNLLGQFNGTRKDQEIIKTRSVTLKQSNFGQWRTPSLRNLVQTHPYMHDGSIETLRGVIDAYADINPERLHTNGESILKPMRITDVQRNDLVEFLKTLSIE